MAVPEPSPSDVTEAVNQPMSETSVLMSTDAPDADGDQVRPSGRFFYTSPHAPPVSMRDPKSLIRKLRNLRQGVVVGLGITAVVAILMLGAFIDGGSTTGDSAAAASDTTPVQAAAPVAPTTETPAPHDTCVLQLYAMVSNMHDNSGGLTQEMLINGQSDPFYREASNIWSKVVSEQYQIGVAAASDNAKVSASTACSGILNDQIRANYPTDGTHPTNNSASSSGDGGGGGSSAHSCPMNYSYYVGDGLCHGQGNDTAVPN